MPVRHVMGTNKSWSDPRMWKERGGGGVNLSLQLKFLKKKKARVGHVEFRCRCFHPLPPLSPDFSEEKCLNSTLLILI